MLLRGVPEGMRLRGHGDYHLGQVLCTGRDFVIIDFEGEPNRSLTQRRSKRSPLRDVAGMLRSFHYAAYTALNTAAHDRPDLPLPVVEAWSEFWYRVVGNHFWREYRRHLDSTGWIPMGPAAFDQLTAYMLEKALYEVGYEIDHRPDQVHIPLIGLGQLIRGETAPPESEEHEC